MHTFRSSLMLFTISLSLFSTTICLQFVRRHSSTVSSFVPFLCQNWLSIWSEMEEKGWEEKKSHSSYSLWFISATVQLLTVSPRRGSVWGKHTHKQPKLQMASANKTKRGPFVSLKLAFTGSCLNPNLEREEMFFDKLIRKSKKKL